MRYIADREEKVQKEKKDASIMMKDPGESRILACELQLMGDYISNLPDEILIHILSFLSTKEAVATSVLAKRWIPLWRFVSSLDFDMTTYCADFRDATYERRREIHCRFVHSVNAVLNSRDLSQPIQRFRLKSSFYPCDGTQINPWINTAMQQKIEHLDLSFVECPIVLPSCTTLVVLKLYRLNAQHLSSVQFPSLKILCLNGVSFWDRSHLARLLSGCPVIEDLEVMQLCYYNFSDIGQDIGQFKSLLPKLVRSTVNCHSIPLIAVENVEFLRINWVDETYVKERNPYSDILLQLTSQFSFCKLTRMEFFFMEYTRYWIQFAVKVLKHSPCLQNLSIQKDQEVWTYIGNDEEELIYSQSVPECFSSHLESCCIHGYLGTDAEFQFAKYVMENAILLQNMTIHYTGVSACTTEKHKIIKLSGLPRESSVQELQLIQHQIRLQESTSAYAPDTDVQKT